MKTMKTRTTCKTLRGYIEHNNRDDVADIASHGCIGGFPGLTYYRDTVALYNRYESEIWDMLNEDADDQGVTIPALIASFNGAGNVGSPDQLYNLLVWYAVERICQGLTEETYN